MYMHGGELLLIIQIHSSTKETCSTHHLCINQSVTGKNHVGMAMQVHAESIKARRH